MANKITLEARNGPRSVCSGLILQAVCKNPQFSVYNKNGGINKIIGTFQIVK
jgi:hypothetical protein